MSGIRVNEWLHNSGTGGIWQTSAGNVGIASSVPTTKLEVTGDAKISGVATATTFSGSIAGSNITGTIPASTVGLTTSGTYTSFGTSTSVDIASLVSTDVIRYDLMFTGCTCPE